MLTIKEHIKKHHGGVQRKMADACDTTEQLVSRWVHQGRMVTAEGFVIQPDNLKRDSTIEIIAEEQNSDRG